MFVRELFTADAQPVLERVLAFTEARHSVLAANVANAETPTWRRQDLPVDAFSRELARAVAGRARTPGRFAMRPVPLDPSVDRGPFVGRQNHAGILRHDGNTVDLDREMAILGRNALLHNTVAALLREKYRGLVAAAEGRNTST